VLILDKREPAGLFSLALQQFVFHAGEQALMTNSRTTAKGLLTLAILLTAVCALPTLAMESPPVAGPDTDEITVVGQRSLIALRMQASKAEDEVHAIFNELNTEEEYDVVCKTEERYFSRMKEKKCLPAYAWDAYAKEGQNFANKIMGVPTSDIAPANTDLAYHQTRLRERMVEVLKDSPELFDAIVKHATLVEELREQQATYFKEEE
jgi:hypothetical protein